MIYKSSSYTIINMITITDSAKEQFKQKLKNRGIGIGFIVGVEGAGCSGYSYTLDFADRDIAGTHINCDDFIIIIDPLAEDLLKNVTIDFVQKGLNSQFEFINPNEKGRCGCGVSFIV